MMGNKDGIRKNLARVEEEWRAWIDKLKLAAKTWWWEFDDAERI